MKLSPNFELISDESDTGYQLLLFLTYFNYDENYHFCNVNCIPNLYGPIYAFNTNLKK